MGWSEDWRPSWRSQATAMSWINGKNNSLTLPLNRPVNGPTKLFGDNLGVIQNASMPAATLQKKHTAISFHRVRECVAAKIIEPHKIDGKDNFADIFTKPVDGTTFKYHAWDLMWKTPTSQ